MGATDKNGDSKTGAGRVALFTASGHPHCYTMELNYMKSMWTYNSIENQSYKLNTKERLVAYEFKRFKETKFFTVDILEGVGKSLLVSILDLIEKNTVSRVNTSPFENLKVRICSKEY